MRVFFSISFIVAILFISSFHFNSRRIVVVVVVPLVVVVVSSICVSSPPFSLCFFDFRSSADRARYFFRIFCRDPRYMCVFHFYFCVRNRFRTSKTVRSEQVQQFPVRTLLLVFHRQRKMSGARKRSSAVRLPTTRRSKYKWKKKNLQ